MISYTIILFLISLILLNIQAQRIDPNKFPVLDPDKCSLLEVIVYILVDNRCNLYKNQCFYFVEQRRRPQDKVKGLVVSRKECLTKCIDTCTEDTERICAEYGGRSYNFLNICDMQRASCKQGKAYNFHYNGLCLQP